MLTKNKQKKQPNKAEEIISYQVILIIFLLSPQFNSGVTQILDEKAGAHFWHHERASLPPYLAETPCRQFNATSRVKSDLTKMIFSCPLSPVNWELQLLTLQARRQFYCWLLFVQKH